VALAGALLCAACGAEPAPTAAAGDPLPGLRPAELASFRAGLAQFNRVFRPEDGLGPLFNENQCSACHTDPAAGGSGGEPVTKATRFVPPDSCDLLVEGGGENIRGQATPAARAVGITGEAVPAGATAQARFTAPFLFGLGLVDAIPEETILRRADPDDADGDGISGRPGRTRDGRMGRFGRKADTATLEEFSLGALNLEMGLTSPVSPLESGFNGGELPPGTDPTPEPEVGAVIAAQLVDFVRFLAPPAPELRGAAHRDSVDQGRRLFTSLGCATCHVPTMTTGPSDVEPLHRKRVALYSDLLLHDMGPGLADVCGVGAGPAEVRTELLMGLRHRDTYLHDGTAFELSEAILRHGGEAQAARDAFAALDELTRLYLLVFLNSL
jgi:CxxC motif-containing protein (DUF1111 family)